MRVILDKCVIEVNRIEIDEIDKSLKFTDVDGLKSYRMFFEKQVDLLFTYEQVIYTGVLDTRVNSNLDVVNNYNYDYCNVGKANLIAWEDANSDNIVNDITSALRKFRNSR